ncbi:MAG: protein kinase, partial [Anaerolineales bacterium]|nr:protein kinase [Anaerolineales bacterium]
DLKSSNILLDLASHTYLADFGLARILSTSTLAFHTGHGTPPYAPPEQNRMKAITSKSDIFSFGILLYEMFTGQLPWNGKKQLGMEQLHSNEELPDPREIKPELPPLLTEVLRRVTSADPARRPPSAGEIMKALHYIFKIPYVPVRDQRELDELTARRMDVDELLRQGLAQWESTKGMYSLGLTRFALVDLERDRINSSVFNRFLLSQALIYGHNDDHWWAAVGDARERLLVASILLGSGNETVAARVVERLVRDAEIRSSSRGLPKGITASLLEIGTGATDETLRRRIFDGLRVLSRSGRNWDDSFPNPHLVQRLGDLALEDSDAGDAAAELIGHLHLAPAVEVITNHHDEDRKIAALLLIQRAAGSLPALVPGGVRLRLSVEWVIQRLLQHPVSLAAAYVMALLGTAIGVGAQVYLTYNLPDFLDIARITTSLEQGLIIGAIFGLGILLIRVIVERFSTAGVLIRLVPATLAGLVTMNIALLVFHILFLSTPPRGFSITAGCALIALTFALGGLSRSRLVKMFVSSAAVFAAIIGTWWLHVNFAASTLDLTPLFRYDYAWSMTQVSLTALIVSLPIGVLGNLINLTARNE